LPNGQCVDNSEVALNSAGGRLIQAPAPLVRLRVLTYVAYMTSSAPDLAVSEARQQLASIIDRARAEHAPVYLARRGRRVAAVIDAEDLERLLELAEDMADIRAAEAARAEMRATGEAPIPWDEVKADLGLV
jgi:prevent-host-death family protein